MKLCTCAVGAALVGLLWCSAATAQDKKPQDKPKPEEKATKPVDAAKPAEGKARSEMPADGMDMDAFMKLAQPGEHHKMMMEHMVGEWTTVNKHYAMPDTPPSESTGTATNKAILGGRYVVGEHKSKMSMPGPDGAPSEFQFEGMGMTGYDNVKQKFVQTWADNMGTGILTAEGTYDPSTKTLTFTGEFEMMPGSKVKFREVIRIIDKNKHIFEWYDDMMGGKEAKRMEIAYTRKGAA